MLELAEQAPLLVGEAAGHHHIDQDSVVAAAEALEHRHPATLETLDLAGLRAGVEVEVDGAFKRLDGDLRAKRGLDMGFYISFAGNSTYPKTQHLRDVAKEIPVDRILIETDSPYLAPQTYRGKRNEPAYVAEVAKTLAAVRNLPPEEFAAATAANFRRLFRIARPDVS